MRSYAVILLILIILCSVNLACAATPPQPTSPVFTPYPPNSFSVPVLTSTPTPTPTPLPTSYDDSFIVRIDVGNGWHPSTPVMKNEHRKTTGLLGDGLLMFMPLSEYVSRFGDQFPTSRLSGQVQARIDCAEDASASYGISLYNEQLYAIDIKNESEISRETLQPGKYLLAVSVTFSCPTRYYTGTCFEWLIID